MGLFLDLRGSMRYLIPIAINLLLAIGALFLKWLKLSGTIAAFCVGTVIFFFTGFGGWTLLLLFFLSSNVLGKFRTLVSPDNETTIQKKRGARDWAQVLANGLLAALSALLYRFTQNQVALVMFGAAIGASTADTWATEVGMLSKRPPLSIRTGLKVPVGMSGGITPLGIFSSALGAIVIALSWYATYGVYHQKEWFFLAAIVAASSIVGSLVDSYLGSTVQGHYWDPKKKQLTEYDKTNGVSLELCRGIRWIDNDVVNFLSNVVAVLFASGLSLIVLL